MADQTLILSVDEEAKLLQPIDEYVGKIQEQIDALRVEGSDRVNSLKNQIAVTKEDKNLSKEEQTKIIEECKKELEKAKSVENTNKPRHNDYVSIPHYCNTGLCAAGRRNTTSLANPR